MTEPSCTCTKLESETEYSRHRVNPSCPIHGTDGMDIDGFESWPLPSAGKLLSNTEPWTVLAVAKTGDAVRVHVYSFATGQWEHRDLDVTVPNAYFGPPTVFFPRLLTDDEMDQAARDILDDDSDDS